MKLDVVVNEAVLANVGATGEFRIRNSAKAFKILSDGLYSNKIRAIIRELSCNAVDSHVAAGKELIPFEVHLPSVFEPWFSVKDFGLGLTGDQVTNIYTTYFESTKTDSNAYIGALGLGSKSPFSYTENFTITAIKDGIKRIYSAFINEFGVPCVAEMNEELTDEGNGVEVKFSVVDRYDYQSFETEAYNVFKWFKLKPNVIGVKFQHIEPDYKEKNIVPNVHLCNRNSYQTYPSSAIMGNICYPIRVPEPHKHFGELSSLLDNSLVFEFDIGDLDFAASREELSYVPITISSIKRKLEELNANLASHLAAKADAITGEWKRAMYLRQEAQSPLYSSAVKTYVANTKFELYDPNAYHGVKVFKLSISQLVSRKLEIKGFVSRHGSCSKTNNTNDYINGQYVSSISIPVEEDVVLVLNDLKTGCLSRARYHFGNEHSRFAVYCITHSDPDLTVRQAEYDKLISELHNPPTILKASELEKQVRAQSTTSNQGIMVMTQKAGRWNSKPDGYMWSPYLDQIDDNEIYYYVCLSNYQAIRPDGIEFNIFEIKGLMDECGIPEIANIKIFGVRKNRIDEIKDLDNWVCVEDKIKEETAKITDEHIASLVAAELLDKYNDAVYTNNVVATLVGSNSYYHKYVTEIASIKRVTGNVTGLTELCSRYGKVLQADAVKQKINTAKSELRNRYPMLKHISYLCPAEFDIAEYIKMVDNQVKQI